jgi:hypothetical protein
VQFILLHKSFFEPASPIALLDQSDQGQGSVLARCSDSVEVDIICNRLSYVTFFIAAVKQLEPASESSSKPRAAVSRI